MPCLYIDRAGKVVIDASQFETAAGFSEGLAAVEVPRKGWGFIDKTGALVTPPTFESAFNFTERFNTDFDFRRNSSDFSEGLAALSEGLNPLWTKEETFVYIDKTGNIVLATDFFYAGQFHDGLASVYSAETDRWGFIDKTGKVAIPLKYESANDFSEGLALVTVSRLPLSYVQY